MATSMEEISAVEFFWNVLVESNLLTVTALRALFLFICCLSLRTCEGHQKERTSANCTVPLCVVVCSLPVFFDVMSMLS